MDEIIAKQGWTSDTVVDLLTIYLAQSGQISAAICFLQAMADEENAEIK